MFTRIAMVECAASTMARPRYHNPSAGAPGCDRQGGRETGPTPSRFRCCDVSARDSGAAAISLAGWRRWLENRPAADRLLAAAFLPMIILVAAIGITAAVAPAGSPAGSEPAVPKIVAIPGDDDGYVEALAKLGIASIPCQSGPCSENVR